MAKLTMILVSWTVAVLTLAGVVYAADGAVPGDTLYGLDRALEDIGICDGGLEERLREAAELMDNGQVDEGLAHVAEALTEERRFLDQDADGEVSEDEESASREALDAAAEAVVSDGSEQSLEVRDQVAEKLQSMATTELTGKEFGQAVSQLARGISLDDQNEGASSTMTTATPTAGSSATTPAATTPAAERPTAGPSVPE